jgi:hypothetical protein
LDIDFIIFKNVEIFKENAIRKKFNEKIQFKKIFKAWCNSRIQFASNESKLVVRNLDPISHLKWV